MKTINQDSLLNSFTNMHDEYIAAWNQALQTGDTSSLLRMNEDYYAAFFNGVSDHPMLFSREDAIAGMEQSVKQLLGAKKRFENRLIRMKDNDQAVVFFEMIVEHNDQVLARLFTTEHWQLTNGQWLLTREIEVPIS